MNRHVAVVALAAFLTACGPDDPPAPAGAFTGSYAFTAVHCNGGAAPAVLAGRMAAPNTWKVASSNGHAGVLTLSDGTCSITSDYTYAYPTSSSMAIGSTGTYGCSPSSAACSTLGSSFYGGTVCGQANAEATNTFTFTTVPTVASGTMTLTATAGPVATACSGSGLTDPLTYTLTRE